MEASYWKIRACAREKRNAVHIKLSTTAVEKVLTQYSPQDFFKDQMIVRASRRTHDGLGAQVLRNDQLLMLLQVALVTRMKILCLPHQWDFNFAYGEIPAMSIFGCGAPSGPIGFFAGSEASLDRGPGARLVIDTGITTTTSPMLGNTSLLCLSTVRPLELPHFNWVLLVQKVLRPQFKAVRRSRQSQAEMWGRSTTLRIALHIRRGDTHPHGESMRSQLDWGNHNVSTAQCKAVETDIYLSCLQSILREEVGARPHDKIKIVVVSTSGVNEFGSVFYNFENQTIFTADLSPTDLPKDPHFPVNDHVATLARDLDFMVSADILIFSPRSEISRLAFALNERQPSPRAFAVRSRAKECLLHNNGGRSGNYPPVNFSTLVISPLFTLPHPLCYPLDLKSLDW